VRGDEDVRENDDSDGDVDRVERAIVVDDPREASSTRLVLRKKCRIDASESDDDDRDARISIQDRTNT
jgi:hypothetical protein